MNGKFVIYALLVSLVCTAMSWTSMFSDEQGRGASSRSGSTWSSNSGGSWGGGGHK